MANKSIVQRQLKLILRPAQERLLNRWLWHLTGVYNWAVTKIERDARLKIYHSRYDLEALVAGHGCRIGIPQVCVADTVRTAHDAWRRFAPVIGDTLWHAEGPCPSGDTVRWWLVCVL
jgi:hypothetical protein